MNMHSIWKGFIQLSLVTIPVKAFSSHEPKREVHLHQLHGDCHQRIKYKKMCPDHGVLQQKDIVKGYEFEKEKYVIVKDEEIAKLRSQNDHAIHIHGFIKVEQFDQLFLDGKNQNSFFQCIFLNHFPSL